MHGSGRSIYRGRAAIVALHAEPSSALGEVQIAPAAAGASLAYVSVGSGGLAILAPLSYGTTLAGLEHATNQRHFLQALAGGHRLVCYDQRGFGAGRATTGASSWEQRAEDLWAVADAAGIERAVLYGVYDAGHTVTHAALLQPARVLGTVFNSVPLHFRAALADSSGVAGTEFDALFRPDAGSSYGRPFQTNVLSLGAADVEALLAAWDTAPPGKEAMLRHESLLRDAELHSLLPALAARALVLGPRRRQQLVAWATALAQLLPEAHVVFPETGTEALGALHAFLSIIGKEAGQQASRLPAELTATMRATQTAVRSLRRIVVPVYPDVRSGRAVELACRLGESQHAEIVLVHVIVVPHALSLDHPLPEAEHRGKQALQFGEVIVTQHGLTARAQLLHERSAAGAIMRIASEQTADLIVVEAEGSGAGEDGTVGRTVQELLRRAPCEVVVDREVSR